MDLTSCGVSGWGGATDANVKPGFQDPVVSGRDTLEFASCGLWRGG